MGDVGKKCWSTCILPCGAQLRRAGENTSPGAAGRPAGNRQADHRPWPARRCWRKLLHSCLKEMFPHRRPLLDPSHHSYCGPGASGASRDSPAEAPAEGATLPAAVADGQPDGRPGGRVLGQGPAGCSPHAPALRPGGCARGAAAGAGDACAGR